MFSETLERSWLEEAGMKASDVKGGRVYDDDVRVTRGPNHFVVDIPASKMYLTRPFADRKVTHSGDGTVTLIVPITEYNAKVARAIARRPGVVSNSSQQPFHPPGGYVFKTEPLKYQLEAVMNTYQRPNWVLFADPGLGKTKMLLDMLSMALEAGRVNRVLVLSPAALIPNWVEEIDKHMSYPVAVLVNRPTSKSRERAIRAGIESSGASIMLSTTESMSGVVKRPDRWILSARLALEYVKRGESVAVVVDESDMLKNPDAARTKNIVSLGRLKNVAVRAVATGSAYDDSPLDVFGQLNFVDPGLLGYNASAFRKAHIINGGYAGKQAVGFKDIDKLVNMISPHVTSLFKDEVLPDLPEKIRKIRYVEMSTSQKNEYQRIIDTGVLLNSDGLNDKIIATALHELQVMQMVCGGYYNHDDGLVEIVKPKDNPKIRAVLEILAEHRQKAIVWATFVHEVEAICKELKENGYEAWPITGAVSADSRAYARDKFKAHPGHKAVLVATHGAMGVGVTVLEAKVSVFYSNQFRYSVRRQTEDRNHRIGQDRGVIYVDIVACPDIDRPRRGADAYVVATMAKKKDVATAIKLAMASGSLRQDM